MANDALAEKAGSAEHSDGAAFRGCSASAHDSTGRARPGNPPHSDDLSAGGALLAEDSGQAPPPSGKDASWRDRAPAERRRDRRRMAVSPLPAIPQRSIP